MYGKRLKCNVGRFRNSEKDDRLRFKRGMHACPQRSQCSRQRMPCGVLSPGEVGTLNCVSVVAIATLKLSTALSDVDMRPHLLAAATTPQQHTTTSISAPSRPPLSLPQ